MTLEQPGRPGALDWAGVTLLVGCAVLAGLLETLLVPLYAGSVLVPVAALCAVLSNIALPRLARSLVPRTFVAATPFVAWLVVAVGFGLVTRPEGDVVLPGSPTSAVYSVYATLLCGAVAGIATLVVTTPPPPRKADLNR